MINYPRDVKTIAEIFAEYGYRAYAVGGCMRDAIMGRTPNDWDMTTDCSPERMLEIFDEKGIRTIPTGLKHGTVSVLIDKNIYECTTFRIDGSYTDSRHPDSVTFSKNIADDLCRRDFTVNAIAGDPLDSNGEVVDLYCGREDIDAKIIRAVGDPEKRFCEDALRILRAIRFATVLDFEIEDETKKAAVAIRDRLESISAERRTVEFQKILLSDHADRGIDLLFETDIAKYIHPELKKPEIALSSLPNIFAVRLAAMFDKIPDLACMKLSNEISSKTRSLCDSKLYFDCRNYFEDDSANARLLISKLNALALYAPILYGDSDFALTVSNEMQKSPCTSISDLDIGGKELISINITPKCIGSIMQKLLLAVIGDQSLNTKETLINMALKIFKDQ